MKRIILASKSPRRKKLLAQLGLKFDVIESDYEEVIDNSLSPSELVKHFSLKKAELVGRDNPGSIVIGADTVVVIDGQIIGKPRDEKIAKEMLISLSGKQHSVFSGYAVIDTKRNIVVNEYGETRVKFRKLEIGEIEEYINNRKPYDLAGGYEIQGISAVFIEGIIGDYYNVVGLPLAKLYLSLKEFGIDVLNPRITD